MTDQSPPATDATEPEPDATVEADFASRDIANLAARPRFNAFGLRMPFFRGPHLVSQADMPNDVPNPEPYTPPVLNPLQQVRPSSTSLALTKRLLEDAAPHYSSAGVVERRHLGFVRRPQAPRPDGHRLRWASVSVPAPATHARQ